MQFSSSSEHLLCALSVRGCRLQVGADTGVNGYALSSGSACLCDREPTINPIFLLSTLPCRSLLPRSVTKKALRSRNISLPASFSHYHHHPCSSPAPPPAPHPPLPLTGWVGTSDLLPLTHKQQIHTCEVNERMI